MSRLDDSAVVIAAGNRAPAAFDLCREMGVYTAEGSYAIAYLAHRLGVIDQRPAASGFGLGVDHAALLRQEVDAELPEDVPPEP